MALYYARLNTKRPRLRDNPETGRYATRDALDALKRLPPKGQDLCFRAQRDCRGVDIWALALDGLKPLRITETAAAEDEPALSPDGRWLAYMSPESGRPEIYVRPFPPKPGNRTTRISTNGGHQPKWRGDGRELFFLTPAGAMMAVDIGGAAAAMEPATPHALFQTGINVNAIVDQYAVTADGQKFLVITPSGDATESPITVVVNWTAGLRR